MHARLFCKTGALAGTDVQLRPDNTIGRRGTNDIALPEEAISGQHARLYVDTERASYVLEDLGSRNGTAVDGIPVTEPVRLGPLHVITFAGTFDFIFQALSEAPRSAPAARVPAAAPAPPPEPAKPKMAPPPASQPEPDVAPPVEQTVMNLDFAPLPDLAPPAAPPPTEASPAWTSDDPGTSDPASDDAPADLEGTRFDMSFGAMPDLGAAQSPPASEEPPAASPAAAAPDVAYALELAAGSDTSHLHVLSPGAQTVGRASECDLRLKHGSISRRHATLIVEDGRVEIRDEGSTHGTFVNGQQVTSSELRTGDLIRFGKVIEVLLKEL